MDKLDVRILRLLMMGGSSFFVSDVRRPYMTIAKLVHVTEDTVRNRVEKLHRGGFIKGWKLGMNPTVFGRRASFLLFDVRPSTAKEDAIRKIKLVDGVLLVLSYFGESLGVHVTYESDQGLKKRQELITRIANSENVVSTNLSFPPCNARLTLTDWSLVKSLRDNPRKPLGVVAKEAGVSTRTAKRRTERLVREGALYTLPDIDVKALKGGVASSLSVFFADPKLAPSATSTIISRFEEHLLLFHAADNKYAWFGFILPNVPKANEIDAWVKGLKGVRGTSTRLVEDYVNLVDEALKEELNKIKAVRIPEIRLR